MLLTESEQKLILELRHKESMQKQRNDNAIKLLEIAFNYATHCKKTGEYPSYSGFNNLYDGISPLIYKQVLQIINLSKSIADNN